MRLRRASGTYRIMLKYIFVYLFRNWKKVTKRMINGRSRKGIFIEYLLCIGHYAKHF